MAEQEQNRGEPASPFKQEEARKQGQVAKSLDFNTAVLTWALLIALVAWGSTAWRGLLSTCAALFVAARHGSEGDGMFAASISMGTTLLHLVVPVAAVAAVFAIVANLVQTGPIFSVVPLKPKWERINPVAGFKRIFNKKMLFEAFKSVLKLSVLGAVGFGYLRSVSDALPSVVMPDSGALTAWLATHAIGLLIRLALALLLIALLDLAYVRWQFRKQMMMSRREVKEEVKRREGDPLIRAKLRELQRENLKQSRSLKRLPEADVLITNPEHIAIALRYVREHMAAPVVIAKGTDDWAQKMKALARRHQVPIYERRALARTLLQRAAIDQAIPGECYEDVARLYAEVEATRRRLIRYEVRA